MSAASPFAAAMLIAALVGLAALLSNRLGERFPVPVSALFLVGGAVPILLGSFIVHAGVPGGRRAYEIIFVQGSAVPALARRLGLPLQTVNPRPWTMNARFEEEPESLNRFTVAPGSAADSATVAGLHSADLWVSVIIRRGRLVRVTPETRLRGGDEVLVLAEPEAAPAVATLFRTDPLEPHPLSHDPTATGLRYFRSASLCLGRLTPRRSP